MTEPRTATAELTFLGGAGSIGASSTLFQVGSTLILVDCGVRFTKDPLPDLSLLSGRKLDAVVLTHAHTDHTGALPVVCEAFPGVPVYATPPTMDLVRVILRDALKLMNLPERDGELPLYTERQVSAALEALVPLHHGHHVKAGEVEIGLLPASHILGAAMAHLSTPAGEILFTGDYSVDAGRTVPALDRPHAHVDLMVTESTYGGRLHEDRKAAEARLVARLSALLAEGARVLIPAFAIGRAQEVLLIIKNAIRAGKLPDVPVFVDGMVRPVCDIYARHERYVAKGLLHEIRKARHAFYDERIRPVETAEDRQAVLATRPCVIVASSGMLSGGASTFYAAALVEDSRDAILITGYQDEESPGRMLLQLSEEAPSDERKLMLGGKETSVACRVETYGLSAHADRMQMVSLISALRPRTVVLVHGDAEARESLASSQSCRDVVLAEDGLRLERSYPARRQSTKMRPVSGASDLDLDTARRLLGPPSGSLVASEAVARAWYGRAVGRADRESLIARLEELGVARRDDVRRSHLWVLSPSDGGYSPEEATLEETLKKENPKGRLLELCMAGRFDPPEQEDLGGDGAHFLARWTLRLGGETLSSGVQRASTKKTAEQLAAQSLLEEVRKLEAEIHVKEVLDESDASVAKLKRENPKGRLIEHFVKRGLPHPTFEARRLVGGVVARVVYAGADGSVAHGPYVRASSSKLAEHGAAKDVLWQLERSGMADMAVSPDADGASDSSSIASSAANDHGPPAALAVSGQGTPVKEAPRKDARLQLNEMRQVGFVEDFGYELCGQQGPSHQPLFEIRAWATLPSGERIASEPGIAPSKKAAERAAAERLYEVLCSSGSPHDP